MKLIVCQETKSYSNPKVKDIVIIEPYLFVFKGVAGMMRWWVGQVGLQPQDLRSFFWGGWGVCVRMDWVRALSALTYEKHS